MDLIVLCGVKSCEDYRNFVDFLRGERSLSFINTIEQLTSAKRHQIKAVKTEKKKVSSRVSKKTQTLSSPKNNPLIFVCENTNELQQIELLGLKYHSLLFYEDPEQFIVNSKEEYEFSVVQWQAYAEQLFSFYMNNINNVTLINTKNIYNNPANIIQYLSDNLDTEIENNILLDINRDLSLSKVAMTLSCFNRLVDNTVVQALYEQLESAAEFVDDINLASLQSRQQYILMQIIERSAVLEKENAEFKSATEVNILKLSQLQEELELGVIRSKKLEKQNSDLSTQVDALSSLRNENKISLENLRIDNKHLKEENELCVLQIQQLQEELKSSLEIQKTNTTRLDVNNKEIEKFLAEKSQLESNKKLLEKQKFDISENYELSLLQIKQLQEELEYIYLKLKQNQAFDGSEFVDLKSTLACKDSVRLISYLS